MTSTPTAGDTLISTYRCYACMQEFSLGKGHDCPAQKTKPLLTDPAQAQKPSPKGGEIVSPASGDFSRDPRTQE